MVQLLQGMPRVLDQTNRAIRRQISDQAGDIEFADIWRTGGNVIPPSRRNPVRIDNQGVGYDVIDNTGTSHGRGQQIVARGGNATYAIVCVADSLRQLHTDPDHPQIDTVMALLRNALKLSASSDPGCVYIVVP
ncbi:hypothetical protein E1200_06730 [Actinomadura sp. GC306]|uniref:hypothetical protein n=1 Tax=Actinomadura sp. GC306 TaxID=2530367 RepID=UPI0010437514|nr:hypothetical protein [Actinomadura sp. GC306]TDC69985.1 hypothetical protein E1200_06730 [Actinomadura sp. GC306]